MIDFYGGLLLPILKAACQPMIAAKQLRGQSDGFLTSVHNPPWLCHIFDGITPESDGSLTFLRYTTLHRLYIQWQAWDVAERELANLSNMLVQHLLGRAGTPLTNGTATPHYKGGVFTVSPLSTGFVAVGTTTYRIADVRSTLGIKLSQNYWSTL